MEEIIKIRSVADVKNGLVEDRNDTSPNIDYVAWVLPIDSTSRSPKDIIYWEKLICAEYTTTKYLGPTKAKGNLLVVDNIWNVIKYIQKGDIKVNKVVCPFFRGLDAKMTLLVARAIMELKMAGIGIEFVKDNIEFDENDDLATTTTKLLKHIGAYTSEAKQMIDNAKMMEQRLKNELQ